MDEYYIQVVLKMTTFRVKSLLFKVIEHVRLPITPDVVNKLENI